MTDAAVVPEGQGLSQIERVVDTFVAPSKTFKDILRSKSWWLPFVLGSICAYLLTFGIAKNVGWSELADNTMHSNPKAEEKLATAPPDQAAMQRKIMTYSMEGGFYASPVINLLGLLFFSVVMWPTINFLFAGKATYGQVFCVFNYAFLPACIKALVVTVLLFFGGTAENFTVDNMLGTSPGYYIETPGALKTFLTSFDVFQLWTLVLLSIGLAIVAKTKRSNGFIAVFGWWLLIVLVKTAWAAAFS